MKKAPIFLLILAFGAVFTVVFSGEYFNKKVVLLKDGTEITVTKTWQSGTDIFYENEEEIHFVNADEVDRIEDRNINNFLVDLKQNGPKYVRNVPSKVKLLLESRLISSGLFQTFIYISAGISIIFFVLILFVRQSRSRSKRIEIEPQPVPVKEIKQGLPTPTDVVQFFLNLYRQQIGADASTPMDFVPLKSDTSSQDTIFELRVRQYNDWSKRRMTLGPLGEDSGSKSKCYYVIYGQHLVVKIPAKPIRDFEEYIRCIKKEAKIVEKLGPKECIIPKVSVILSLIHKLPDTGDVSAELTEEKYIEWIRKNPELQENLKINDTFVFFMDLSKYYFLGHILDNLHHPQEAIPVEIGDNPEIIWEPAKFKGRYGKKNETVCFEIRDVYNRCEAEIRRLLREEKSAASVSTFRMQSWFLTYLAGKEISIKHSKLPPELNTELNRLIRQIFNENHSAVESYLKTIREYVHRITAEQNKPVMAGIITNLLELLAWLRDKKVAMRDLKPDNLLVAGDPKKYPVFLHNAEEYSLGIIDVETAVDFGKSDHQKLKQPLLGGTPFYATPAHFIDNETLRGTYKNVDKILHLQDWYATLVMIYKVVTGELLFDQSPKLFAEIKNKIMNAIRQKNMQPEVVEEISHIFWRSAASEFQTKVREKEALLKSVESHVPKKARKLFKKFLVKDINSIKASVERAIQSQTVLSSANSHELLLKCSHSKICQIIAELENKENVENKENAMRMLNRLATLKLLSNRKAQLIELLEQPDPKMTTYDLLVLMFNTVMKSMYLEQWNRQPMEFAQPACPNTDDISLATTI